MLFPVGYRSIQENYSYSTAKPTSKDNPTNTEDRILARRGNNFLMQEVLACRTSEATPSNPWTDTYRTRRFTRNNRKITTSSQFSPKNTRTPSRSTLNTGWRTRTGITTRSYRSRTRSRINWTPTSRSSANWPTQRRGRRWFAGSTWTTLMRWLISCDRYSLAFLCILRRDIHIKNTYWCETCSSLYRRRDDRS